MKKKSQENIEDFLLRDDGIFPNNGMLPLLIYHDVLSLDEKNSKAASQIEETFEQHNWKNSWRNGVYDYHHYHSITHEVLGIYSGSATVQFGGPAGITVKIKKGDVIIIPAGVAHKNIESDKDFKCVGAYPDGMDYDMNYGKEKERPKADENIRRVKMPDEDPVFGKDGPLPAYWK